MEKKMMIGVFILLSALQVQASNVVSPNQKQTWGQWLRNYFKKPDRAVIEKRYIDSIRDNILKYIEQNNKRKELQSHYDKEYKRLVSDRDTKYRESHSLMKEISIESISQSIDEIIAQENILFMRDKLFASIQSSIIKKITDSYYLLHSNVFPVNFAKNLKENKSEDYKKSVEDFNKTIDDMIEFFKRSINQEGFFSEIEKELKGKKTRNYFIDRISEDINKDDKGYITIENVWNDRLRRSQTNLENK